MKNNISIFFKKFFSLLEKLSSKPKVGGVYISTAGVQYVQKEKGELKNFFFRFPPGVIDEKKISDKEKFIKVLEQLHAAVSPDRTNWLIPIVVSLPAGVVYTQGFSVPNLDLEKVKESAELNLQMLSPIPVDEAFLSWQIIEELPDKYEMLGAFVEKKIIRDIKDAFAIAHFHVLVFEFPSLSISHLFTKEGLLPEKAALVLQVTSDGLDLSILKLQSLHFSYFRSWRSIQGENNQITRDMFDRAVVEEVQKVVNFAGSRFKEHFEKAYIIAPGFEEEIRGIFQNYFQISAIPLAFSAKNIAPIWYVPWGAAVRGEIDPSRDSFLNLNTESSSDVFFQEHTLRFISLWRNIILIVLLFLLVLYGGAAYFLGKHQEDIRDRIGISQSKVNQKDLSLLQTKAREFNSFVSGAREVINSTTKWGKFLSDFFSIAAKEGISVRSISFSEGQFSAKAIARAANYSSAISLKNALLSNPDFSSVELPLGDISEGEGGVVNFSITFSFKNPSAKQ